MRLHSYIVRYDSGFAPNPFSNFCTLATCKPDIRRTASVGDWVMGSGSANRTINRGGKLVYAMRVMETLTFNEYWADPRFEAKKPSLFQSRARACGDNIYRKLGNGHWAQLDSFHTKADGSQNVEHIKRDTSANRVLVSTDFVYFGGRGPKIPAALRNFKGRDICVNGRGRKLFDDQELIAKFVDWVGNLGVSGYVGEPTEWVLQHGG